MNDRNGGTRRFATTKCAATARECCVSEARKMNVGKVPHCSHLDDLKCCGIAQGPQCGLRLQHLGQALDVGFRPVLLGWHHPTGEHATTELMAAVSPERPNAARCRMFGLRYVAQPWLQQLGSSVALTTETSETPLSLLFSYKQPTQARSSRDEYL